MMKFLRENGYAAGIFTIIRIVLGWQWMTAGWHKIVGDTPFNAGGFLNNAIANPVIDKATQAPVYPNFIRFLEGFALPNVKLINILIPWGEFLVGLGLILGALTTAAAFFGLMMNFMFLFAGTVSTNPWLILLGVIVLAAGAGGRTFGLDRYILPLLNKGLKKLLHKDENTEDQDRHTPANPTIRPQH